MEKFTADNYKKGFLIDEELMAGITENESVAGQFTAYIVRHTTGETLGVREFDNLFEALRTLNEIPRNWAYEAVSKCGGGNCGKGGCGTGGGCHKGKSSGACSDNRSLSRCTQTK
jgi:hypothetical protein